jgi:beta-fructofuranosidase
MKMTLATELLFPALCHPLRHVWDFWYYFDRETEIFHVFYLNAHPSLVATEQHHFSAQVGYATTKDFLSINWILDDILCADPNGWDNTAIWSGDIIRVNNGFLMFYTSRNCQTDDGFTQNIGAVYSPSVNHLDYWQRLPIRIQPQAPYELRGVVDDTTIHAWRDPFLFCHQDNVYMLLSAKDKTKSLGRKGAVAILRAQDRRFEQWEYLPPIASPGFYSELEVPQLYIGRDDRYTLIYSSWAKHDFAPHSQQSGGLHGIVADNPFNFDSGESIVLLPEAAGLYACRVIPELDGEIVGFDARSGGIRRSGVKTYLRHLDRDFSKYAPISPFAIAASI